jgi:hypothetical protein
MWYAPHLLTTENAHFLSIEYDRDWRGKRDPIMVHLPGGAGVFCVDQHATRPSTDAERHGWTVTGEPPAITVHPSIDAGASFHGWLRDGVLTTA